MPTPAFVPQPSSLSTTIRYFTPLDPYHYTVDNRPLSDFETNLVSFGTVGVDSARRAALLGDLSFGQAFKDLFGITSSNSYYQGLQPGYTGSTFSVGTGSLFISDAVYSGSSQSTVKAAVLATPLSVTMNAPGGAGTSVDYLVQVKFNYLTASVSSALPYFDSANIYIPSGTLTGEMTIGLKTGSAAATGSQVTPSVDAGWSPLYVMTYTYGQSAPNVRAASGAPSYRKAVIPVGYLDSVANSASSATINGTSVPKFLEGIDSNIAFGFSLKRKDISPYHDLRVRLACAGSIASGDVNWRMDSLVIGHGSLTTTTPTVTTSLLTLPGTANQVTADDFGYATLSIPNTDFSGFNAGVWAVTKESVICKLTRLSAGGGADTATGDVTLLNLEMVQ